MQPAETVWLSEQTRIRMGTEPQQTQLGLLTAQCSLDTHIVFGRIAQEKTSFQLVFPCAHHFDYLFPQPIEWRSRFLEPQPVSVRTQYEWGMWLPLSEKSFAPPARVQLVPISTIADWQSLRTLRMESIAMASEVDQDGVERSLKRTRDRHRHLLSMWYLASAHGQIIGEIGLIFCAAKDGIAGRLQDVHILPRWQKQGYGQELLEAIGWEAQRLGMLGLCLCINAGHGARDWFVRSGFEPVATWTRFKGIHPQL